jgi:hypothetical protein
MIKKFHFYPIFFFLLKIYYKTVEIYISNRQFVTRNVLDTKIKTLINNASKDSAFKCLNFKSHVSHI